jgi:hypothetical protein
MIAAGVRKGVQRDTLTAWFLIGTILPDVLTRPVYIVFPSLHWFVMPLHTPIGLFLVCQLISRFLPPQQQRPVFYNLMGGAVLHLLLDICQKQMGDGYHLFFPFSWSSFEIGLFWAETSLYLLPLWLGIGVFLVGRWMFRHHKRNVYAD